jgi:dTDP-4-amino-4,6-dideoxygalactose transaminase
LGPNQKPIMSDRINVTKTHLPSLEKYQGMVEEIWRSGQLTNYGQYSKKLESELRVHLGVKHLILVSNGTIALQLAIKALDLKGEIITTPFSYVATVSTIVWEGCKPVFVDIDPADFCIDVNKIEEAITPHTTAILATHVYGNPCAVGQIKEIAERNNLKVIYDAAHAFDVKLDGDSVLNHGDISTLSFHATKVFHTGEGGAVITNDDELAHRLKYLGNFGHNGTEAFFGLGVNAKVSEFHAAMGLCMLPEMPQVIENRKLAVELYDEAFNDLSEVYGMHINSNVSHNYSYYPVVFNSEQVLLEVQAVLNKENVFPRRYFYPSLNKLPYLKEYKEMPIAEGISTRILCLPLSSEISETKVKWICNIIENVLTKN